MAIVAQLSWVLGFVVAVAAVLLTYAAAVFLGIVLAERRFARADAIAREQSIPVSQGEDLIDGERRITF